MVRVQRLKHAYIAAVFTRFGVGACRPQSQRLCHQRMPKQLRYHALPASPFLLLDKSAGRCQSGGLQRPRLLICKRLLCVCVCVRNRLRLFAFASGCSSPRGCGLCLFCAVFVCDCKRLLGLQDGQAEAQCAASGVPMRLAGNLFAGRPLGP